MCLKNICLVDKRGNNLSLSSYCPQRSRMDLYGVNCSTFLGCTFVSAKRESASSHIVSQRSHWMVSDASMQPGANCSQVVLQKAAGDCFRTCHFGNSWDKRYGPEDVQYFTKCVDYRFSDETPSIKYALKLEQFCDLFPG